MGTVFEEYTLSSSDGRPLSERKQRGEEYRFTKDDLRNFDSAGGERGGSTGNSDISGIVFGRFSSSLYRHFQLNCFLGIVRRPRYWELVERRSDC